jgi:hypothetical protein
MVIPDGRARIEIGDRLYVIGSTESVEDLTRRLNPEAKPISKVVIYGATQSAIALAARLEDTIGEIAVIEPDNDLAEAAGRMAPLLCHTTAADYQLRPRFLYRPGLINYEAGTPWSQMVPMGEGFIDYKGYFDALRAGGYNGTVAFEMCAPLLGGGSIENLDRHAARFLEFLQPWR